MSLPQVQTTIRQFQSNRDNALILRHSATNLSGLCGDTSLVTINGTISVQMLVDSISDEETFMLAGSEARRGRRLFVPNTALFPYLLFTDYNIGDPIMIDQQEYEIFRVDPSPDTDINNPTMGMTIFTVIFGK